MIPQQRVRGVGGEAGHRFGVLLAELAQERPRQQRDILQTLAQVGCLPGVGGRLGLGGDHPLGQILAPDLTGCHPAESRQGLRDIKAITLGMLQFRIHVPGLPPDTQEETTMLNLTGKVAIVTGAGKGLGWALMQLIIEYARSEGLKTISGDVLRENVVMLDMCRNLGFEVRSDPTEADLCKVQLKL